MRQKFGKSFNLQLKKWELLEKKTSHSKSKEQQENR